VLTCIYKYMDMTRLIIFLYQKSYSYDIIIKGIRLTFKFINDNTCINGSAGLRYISSVIWLIILSIIELKKYCTGWLSLDVVVICLTLEELYYLYFSKYFIFWTCEIWQVTLWPIQNWCKISIQLLVMSESMLQFHRTVA
jgi:hypothetical protein